MILTFIRGMKYVIIAGKDNTMFNNHPLNSQTPGPEKPSPKPKPEIYPVEPTPVPPSTEPNPTPPPIRAWI